ncbi:MAG: Translocation and assembly module TamB [Candidatus Anoxychlamydiales bacterium]|nr:Translocation and assembly module TamB [Candidatus Anoxychlamydiales bacterium]
MKKPKHQKIFYHLIIWIIAFFFIAISASIITLQTSYGKEKIKASLISFFQKNNIDIQIGTIDGLVPFEYKFKNVSIGFDSKKIEIEKLYCRIKFIPLLKKDLSFKSFVATNITYKDLNSSNISKSETDISNALAKNVQKTTNWISIPIRVNFDSLKLNDLHIEANDTDIAFNITGKAKILKFGKMIKADLDIRRKDFPKSYLEIFCRLYKKDRAFRATSHLNVASSNALKPFYKKDTDFAFNITVDSNGYLNTFENLENLFSKIEGKASGSIFKIENLQNEKLATIFNKESNFSFDFATLNDMSLNISKAYLKNDLLQIYLDALLRKNLSIAKSNITMRVDELKKLNSELFGSFIFKSSYENSKLFAEFNFLDFSIADVSFIDLKGIINGNYSNDVLTVKLNANTFLLNQAFKLTSDLKYANSFLSFLNLNINSPSSNLLANVSITPSFNLIGTGRLHFEDLSQLQALKTNLTFNGRVDTKFEFNQKVEADTSFQNLYLNIDVNDYYFEKVYGKTAKLLVNIDNPFSTAEIDLKSRFKDLKFHDLQIDKIDFSTSTNEENWPYQLNLIANLKKPFEMDSTGFFKIKKDAFTLNIQDLKGNLFNQSFISPKPIFIDVTKDKFLLSDLDIEFATGSILADINFSNKKSTAKINLKNFPLDFLSINPLDLDVTGNVDLNLDLEKRLKTVGSLDISINNLNILALADKEPLRANFLLKSTIEDDYFNFDSSMKLKNTQLMKLQGKLPIDLDLVKLKIGLNNQKSLLANINYNGKVEELLDFVNIGPQRVEGDLKTDLKISNNLKDLKIDGTGSFKNGYFENYYTGTIIKDIDAEVIAKDEKITLEYLKGKDPEGGKLQADGIFSLSEKKEFAFYFKAQLHDLLCVDSNIIRSSASAIFEISGDRLSSIAKGSAKINNLEMTIPDKLPIVIPDLKPTFISFPYAKNSKQQQPPKIYPIHLNFDLNATSPIKINGQGLKSTWMGNFKIGGTYMNFETLGELKLLKGSYVFAGRHFDLTKGSVMFTGKPNELPILDISATMNQKGVKIIADVEGPLDTPKISFSSIPPLPSSSILSLLIFGQQLSELTDFQTVELATTMSQDLDDSTLSSNSMANLGIDRFNIVQPSATDPTAPDQMAIQLGKYISKGVVVSLSQGAEQGSSNIIIEVDLKKGFIFQAESQQEQEQGKFSLKWRHNY